VRYPRGTGPGVEIQEEMTAIPIGKAERLREGKRIAILAFGTMVEPAMEVAEKIDASVVNMRFVKPIDTELVLEMVREHELIVTVEENTVMGGAGDAVVEVMSENAVKTPVILYGLPDHHLTHGSREDMLEEAGLTSEGLLDFIQKHTMDTSKVSKITSAKSA